MADDSPKSAPSPSKRYHSIREVSELLDTKAHVLRYWETQFSVLRPKKSRSGARMYQERDLDILRSIKEMLYERGYTIAGAKKHLLRERKTREEPRPQLDLDFLSPKDRKQLRIIRDELMELRDWLVADGEETPRKFRPRSQSTGGQISVEQPGAPV